MALDPITAGIDGVMNIGSTLIQNAAQKKAQQREFDNNKEMWTLANQYNSPVQQMARLKEAGLNPNLVYGNGATGNTSTQTPKYQAPQLNRIPLEKLSPFDVLGKYLDLKQKNAMANLAEENAGIAKKENDYKIMNLDALLDSTQEGARKTRMHNLFQEWIMNSPANLPDNSKNAPMYQRYQGELKSIQNKNTLDNISISSFKNLPKELQIAMPWILKIFGR